MAKIDFIHKALLIDNILVISDLHIGYEEALNKQGMFVPRHQFEETMQDLEELFKKIKMNKLRFEEIVILGDLKHEFGEISQQEWKDAFAVLNFLLSKCKKIICVRGNHDTILEPILRRFAQVEFKEFYIKNEICFIHGNKFPSEIFSKQVKRIVMGHIHPAVTIRHGIKRELYKCYLVGKLKGKKLIILPSFFPIVEGSDVKEGGFFTNLDNFQVYVQGDMVYEFGKVKDIK